MFLSLTDRMTETPRMYDVAAADRVATEIGEVFSRLPPPAQHLVCAVASASPFLSRQMARDPDRVAAFLARPPETSLADILAEMRAAGEAGEPRLVMQGLRRAKNAASLLIALAEISGAWPTMEAAAALSDVADAATGAALRAALRGGSAKNFPAAYRPYPEEAAGIAVLAMGKLGARELNYSSDIDLIVLFDPQAPSGLEPQDARSLAIAAARQLVKFLSEQTADGYVFRTDLRLRPDPGASAAAVSTRAAEAYYEAYGQNWERAAFIKARAAAGDLLVGEAFLATLRPFIWRKYLDYAAIEDIHSIKRQIHAVKGGGDIEFYGQDVKIGRGGIREIEFLAQTQQLILGGKDQSLRPRRTLDALKALAAAGRMDAADVARLSANYVYLRRVEHRVQMINDEQTHKIPREPAEAARLAAFLGEESLDAFEQRLIETFRSTHHLFADLFEREERLSGPTGSLVFTGVENDPSTLETLRRLGFRDPAAASDRIRRWHMGAIRATRSARARELLTKLKPRLLEALARAGDPDAAFAAFDAFLERLPAGVQVFSMFVAHPEIFDILIRLLTVSPFLGRALAKRRHLIEAALQGGWPGPPPDPESFRGELADRLSRLPRYEDKLNDARRWGLERNFDIAARLVLGEIDGEGAARLFTPLAEAAVAALLDAAAEDHARQYGAIDGALCVLALGRLGAAEMTAKSDLDLVFIYDAPADAQSDGERPLDASTYYLRLVRKFIAALSAATEEGALYEVDMKLRPSGAKGPWAVSRAAFEAYYAGAAWTWEEMALLKARVVAGTSAFCGEMTGVIQRILTRPRDTAKLTADVADMMARIDQSRAGRPEARNPMDVKHVRGGLAELDFILARAALKAAATATTPPPPETPRLIDWLDGEGALPEDAGRSIRAAFALYREILQIGRAATGEALAAPQAGETLAARVAEAAGAPSLAAAERRLTEIEADIRGWFEYLIRSD